MEDYKSLCAAVTICSTLVNIQSHTHRQHLTSLFDKLRQASQKEATKKTSTGITSAETYQAPMSWNCGRNSDRHFSFSQ